MGASEQAKADAKTFTVKARRGSTENGICSGVFLEENFRTDRFSMTVTVHGPDSWSYEESTILKIKGVRTPFDHRDKNALHRVQPAKRNPLARGKRKAASREG